MVVIHCLISSKNGNWLQRFTLGGKQQHNTPESIFSEEEKCSVLWGVYMQVYGSRVKVRVRVTCLPAVVWMQVGECGTFGLGSASSCWMAT